MGQRFCQAQVACAPGIQSRVRQHQLFTPEAHVEFDVVDADHARGVERGERIGPLQGAGAAVADALQWHHEQDTSSTPR